MSQTVRAQRRKYHIVYKTTCLVTGRYYIGLHSTDDLDDRYLGSGVRLNRSVAKHGRDQHIRETLETFSTREAASEREKELITPELRSDPLCMNCGAGGLGTVLRSATTEETRRKCSEAAKAGWVLFKERGYAPPNQTERAKAKRAEANRGQKRSEEQLANLAAGQRKYYETVDKEVLKQRGQKGGATRSKEWVVTRPDGSTFITKDLAALSIELGVSRSSIYHACNRGTKVAGHQIARK
jgi:hypothetical protein